MRASRPGVAVSTPPGATPARQPRGNSPSQAKRERTGYTASLGRPAAARLRAGLPALGLDREFRSSDSLEVDPDLRIILGDLGEHVVAVRAAEHDAGTSVEVNGPGRPGRTAAAAGPDRGWHLGGEHLLEDARDRVPVRHRLRHAA